MLQKSRSPTIGRAQRQAGSVVSWGKNWWQSREPESPFPWGHSYRFLLFCAVHGIPRGPCPKPAVLQECAGGPRSVRLLHPVPHQLRVLRTHHPSQLGGPTPACALPRASASSKALTHSSTQLELSVWGPREAAAQNTGPNSLAAMGQVCARWGL